MRDVAAALRNVPLILGLIGSTIFVIAAAIGPELAPHDPNAEHWILFGGPGEERYRYPPTAPDARFPLGTDGLGRDLLSRFLFGAQLTLGVVALALAARMLIGLLLGGFAGWYGGTFAAGIRQLTLAVTGGPQLAVALVLVLLLRDLGPPGFAIALALVGWGEVATFTAQRVGGLRSAPHVESARALGVKTARLVRVHVLQTLLPSLISLAALETAAVLLLLAELGVIGVFIAGATYYLNDAVRSAHWPDGVPILPLRDRAPEWGQMLSGISAYGNEERWIVLIPALVVAAAVFSFNLLGEGIRGATDPFAPLRLSPRGIAWLGRGAMAALVLVGGLAAAPVVLRSDVDLAEGRRLAADAAERVDPRARFVAAAARFRAEAHALGQPAKLNYYFLDSEDELIRIGLPDGEPLKMEVRRGHDEDGVSPFDFHALPEDVGRWEEALRVSQDEFGDGFRASYPSWEIGLILAWPRTAAEPRYEVEHRSGPVRRSHCCFSARSGGGSQVDLAEGQRLAAEAAERTDPSARAVAAVARFRADAHGLERAAKLNYYFLTDDDDLIRIGIRDADPLAVEIAGDDEDAVSPYGFRTLPGDVGRWEEVLRVQDQEGGRFFRVAMPDWQIELVLSWPSAAPEARYEVFYASGRVRESHCCFDLRTGALSEDH